MESTYNILPLLCLRACALLQPSVGHLTEWMPLKADVALPRVPACLHCSIRPLFGQMDVNHVTVHKAKVV